MARARWFHVAPTGLAETSAGAGYKQVAPLGLVNLGGRPRRPTPALTRAAPLMPNMQTEPRRGVECSAIVRRFHCPANLTSALNSRNPHF